MGGAAEYRRYLEAVAHRPIDFGSIRRRLCKVGDGAYTEKRELFADMANVFRNAMAFNSEGDSWYDEAARLFAILRALKKRRPIAKELWKASPEMAQKCARCPHCQNLILKSART